MHAAVVGCGTWRVRAVNTRLSQTPRNNVTGWVAIRDDAHRWVHCPPENLRKRVTACIRGLNSTCGRFKVDPNGDHTTHTRTTHFHTHNTHKEPTQHRAKTHDRD